jgi:hypothetical protein
VLLSVLSWAQSAVGYSFFAHRTYQARSFHCQDFELEKFAQTRYLQAFFAFGILEKEKASVEVAFSNLWHEFAYNTPSLCMLR